MNNYNEYLEFCKKSDLNPMDEKNLREFNKQEGHKLVKVGQVLAPLADKELPVKAAEGLKDLIGKYVEFANDKEFKPVEKPNQANIKRDLDTLLFLLSL